MKLLLICNAGMSTSILVQALETEAKKMKIENFIAFAIPENDLDNHIGGDYEYVLVAPQIRYKFDRIAEAAKENNKKVYLIEPMEYVPIGAATLLKNVMKL